MAEDSTPVKPSVRDKRPLVEFHDVHKKLGGRPILDGLTFDVRKGETFVIIGYSGTGKSVTLRNLIGLMKPDKGSIRVAGEEVTTMKPRELEALRRNFGVLFQSGALINWLSVYENVELPLLEHTRHSRKKRAEIIKTKLELVNLWNDREKTPAEISGGMKKRAGLARAISLDPELVLYDEPTSGLDPVIANEINKLIISLRDQLGMTSIVVTHDMESAYEIADRIAMFYHGKRVAVGTPDEIRTSLLPEVQHFISGGREGALSMRSRAAVESGKPPVFSMRRPSLDSRQAAPSDSSVIVLEDADSAILKAPDSAPLPTEVLPGPVAAPKPETEPVIDLTPAEMKEVPAASKQTERLPPLPEFLKAEIAAARARASNRQAKAQAPAAAPPPQIIEEVSEDLPELAPEPHNEAARRSDKGNQP